MTTRREFLKQSGITLAAMGTAHWAAATPPSEQIRIGFIGVGNQGKGNLKRLTKHAVAVCEVDKARLHEAQASVEKANGSTCAAYADYRRLLDSKDVDAVLITTPDHWHAKMTVDACNAGKDVYCEKPLTLTVTEGRAMVEAARRNRRIVQTGSQQRSAKEFRLACELVRNGRLGKVTTVRVGLPGVNFKGPAVPDSTPPAELDYDFWLGPAPLRPYNVNRVHYNFRFFWDYSGGQLTNWGAHHLDIVQWALDQDAGGPLTIEGQANYHKDRWYEVPESMELTYRYPGHVTVLCGKGQRGGITFEGEKGQIFVNRGKLESTPGDIIKEAIGAKDVRLYASNNHHDNWLECIKTRKAPICDVEIGHRSATVCHLGNIALLTGRKITWDAAKEMIVGDTEAGQRLSKAYRAPWKLT